MALQWIGLRPSIEYKLIMRTFLDVFPQRDAVVRRELHGRHAEAADARIGTRIRSQAAGPQTRAALNEIGLTSFDVLRSWYTGGPEELRRYVGAGPLLTDDRPLLEYHRLLSDDPEPLDLAALRGDVSRIVR